MSIVKNIGKNTIGDNDKMKIEMRNYEMSTQRLSESRATTMSAGTLNPVYQMLCQPGDDIEIDLGVDIYTEPTVGTNFDEYIYEQHVFTADLRLYQSMLQNNELDAGMNMENVTLPQLILSAQNTLETVGGANDYIDSNSQVNPSSILSRLNIKGVGHSEQTVPKIMEREFHASFWLAYWDIFKNFYANRQEKNAYVIHNEIPVNFEADITHMYYIQTGSFPTIDLPPAPAVPPGTVQPLSPGESISIQFPTGYNINGVYPEYVNINMVRPGETMTAALTDIFNEVARGDNGTIAYVTCIGVKPQYYGWTPQNYDVIDYNTIPELPPTLEEFPLTNLDDMRRKILSSPTGLIIDQNEIAPYGLALERYTDPVSTLTKTSIQGTQEGLAVKTYFSDLFNNWIRTEFVEQTNLTTAVNTASGSFTMDALNFAKKFYELENRISLSGGSIDDWFETVWGSGRPSTITTPEYRGGMRQVIDFVAVASTAATPDAPLGKLAGRGITHREQNGGKIKIKIGPKACVLLVIASITPRIRYSQGNAWENNLRTMDDIHKPALDGIGYQGLITDQFDWRDTEYYNTATPVSSVNFRQVGYQPAWVNYTTGVNRADGNFAILTKNGYMINDRGYEWTRLGTAPETYGTKDKTTYIDPAHWNYTFAITSRDAMNFQVVAHVHNIARRKMSARQIPNL